MQSFIKNLSKYHHLVGFGVFALVTLSIISLTLVLVRTNQDTRSRAASSPCTLTNSILIDSFEQEYMRILNEHRESLGRGPLRLSEKLTRSAQWQGEDMVENNYFNHTDSLGRGYQQRSIDCGITTAPASENIANGAIGPMAAFNAWQASTQGHKENMEDGRWTQTGIARVVSGGQGRWVQTFSVGNDGTSPELENPNTPTVTPTTDPTITVVPTVTTTITPNPSLTPNPTQPNGPTTPLKFSFKMPGIGGNVSLGENPNPQGQGRGIEIQILDSNGKVLETRYQNTTLNKNTYAFEGTINLPNSLLLPDNFLKLVIPRARPHEIIVKSLPQNNPLIIPTLIFRTGDLDNNGLYDLNDYVEQVACIKKVRCEKGGEYYDLNSDGNIDVVDLNILLRTIRDFNQ